jgi:hypothetical protein
MPAAASPEAAAAAAAVASAAAAAEESVNRQLLAWGLSPEVARDAVNPGFAGNNCLPLPWCCCGNTSFLSSHACLLACQGLPPPATTCLLHARRPL